MNFKNRNIDELENKGNIHFWCLCKEWECTIAIDASSILENVHLALQESLDFENDHPKGVKPKQYPSWE
ncbi:hypothetical protein [Desulfocicer vacuolatum]|uniref:hypothetical protein n=1 Tax=Desulfocicer vacuolatum TaxID=2298 RepID=UPI00111BDC9E|nr:hypothetical protein [Desulfocicer vacuolatum]